MYMLAQFVHSLIFFLIWKDVPKAVSMRNDLQAFPKNDCYLWSFNPLDCKFDRLLVGEAESYYYDS